MYADSFCLRSTKIICFHLFILSMLLLWTFFRHLISIMTQTTRLTVNKLYISTSWWEYMCMFCWYMWYVASADALAFSATAIYFFLSIWLVRQRLFIVSHLSGCLSLWQFVIMIIFNSIWTIVCCWLIMHDAQLWNYHYL